MTLRTGSLFSGYGGLDLAVNAFYGAETAWHVEFDAAPSRILDHHWPDVPNFGDVTAVDWAAVPPVDILTGGFPCQDVSAAGRRAGLGEGTRSGLWSYMAEAINQLRPRYVVIENVRGLLSATADRPVESGSNALGDGRTGPVLRALGAVLGDLSDIGYDAQWATVAAADVGACHERKRVFILATPADAERGGWDGRAHDEVGCAVQRVAFAGCGEGGRRGKADLKLLPTPRASDGSKGGPNQRGSSGDLMLPSAVVQWGPYEDAIRHAELAFGYPSPSPTEVNRAGNPYLSAAFSEWMMMIPAGWVTDPTIWDGYTPAAARNIQLKAIGNGVCPRQAFYAVSMLHQIASLDEQVAA